MIIEVTCPCGCGHTFSVDVKGRKGYSEEERARRAERMRLMRAEGIGGKPKGAVTRNRSTAPRKTRSDKGVARKKEQH